MRTGLALTLAAAAAWMSPTGLTAAEVLRTSITVRVYQTAGLSSTLEQRTLAEVETVLRAALVDVTWRRCSGPNPSTSCGAPPGPSELSLRIVPDATRRHAAPDTLGDAVVDRHAGGVMATVYFDHVARLAKAARTDVAVLLGRAAAHELGHLLMRIPAHPRRGLMRSNWTPGEVRRNRATDWAFAADDMAAMRRPEPR